MSIQDRREREKQENRKTILESAKKVFAQKGFHAATMEEISVVAEFSKGAIYNYFANKETLFAELIIGKLDEIIQIVKTNLEKLEKPEGKIEKMIELILTFFEDEKETFRIIQSARYTMDPGEKNKLFNMIQKKYLEYYSFIKGVIQEGISSGLLKKMDPDMLSLHMLGIITQIIAARISGTLKQDITKLASFTKHIYFEGAKN